MDDLGVSLFLEKPISWIYKTLSNYTKKNYHGSFPWDEIAKLLLSGADFHNASW